MTRGWNPWSVTAVGTFMALWTIGYGVVQAVTPGLAARSADGLSREVPAARLWWRCRRGRARDWTAWRPG